MTPKLKFGLLGTHRIGVQNFIKFAFIFLEIFKKNVMTDRQTDRRQTDDRQTTDRRQTFCHPHTGGKFFYSQKFIPSYSLRELASLTHSVRRG